MKSRLTAMEPHRRQHDCHSVCVIAQQYSSSTFYLLRFHSHKENSVFRRVREISFVMSAVRLSAWNNSAPNGRIFMKVDI
jgi:hypothetical protein